MSVMCQGVIELPESLLSGESASKEGNPLGLTDASLLSPIFDSPNATIFITCFARQGPPVAALKIPLKQKGKAVQFPFAFTIRDTDLLYPLTQSAWAADSRNGEEMGLAVSLDSDSSLVTGSTQDLIGFGGSKPYNPIFQDVFQSYFKIS